LSFKKKKQQQLIANHFIDRNRGSFNFSYEFTCPHVVSNLYDVLSSVEQIKTNYCETFFTIRLCVNGHQNSHVFGYWHSLKYLLLCSTEESHSGLEWQL